MQNRLLWGGSIALSAMLCQDAHADDVTAVTVTVTVTAEVLEIRAQGDGLDTREQQALAADLPRGDGELRALSRTLLGIKRQYADSERLILAPEVALTYPELTGLMDAARELELHTRGEGTSTTLALFSEVILEDLFTGG